MITQSKSANWFDVIAELLLLTCIAAIIIAVLFVAVQFFIDVHSIADSLRIMANKG